MDRYYRLKRVIVMLTALCVGFLVGYVEALRTVFNNKYVYVGVLALLYLILCVALDWQRFVKASRRRRGIPLNLSMSWETMVLFWIVFVNATWQIWIGPSLKSSCDYVGLSMVIALLIGWLVVTFRPNQ